MRLHRYIIYRTSVFGADRRGGAGRLRGGGVLALAGPEHGGGAPCGPGRRASRVAGFNGDGPFSLIDPRQRADYLRYLAHSMDAAKAAGAASLTIHSNALGEGGVVTDRGEGLSDTVRLCAMYEGLKACAAMAEDRGLTLHLEALNPITDHPATSW